MADKFNLETDNIDEPASEESELNLDDIDNLIEQHLEDEPPTGETDSLSGFSVASAAMSDDEIAKLVDDNELLDAELAKALERDQQSDTGVQLEDSIDDFVKDLTVYSEDESFERTVRVKKVPKIILMFNEAIEGVSHRFLMATAWILFIIIVLVFVIGIRTMIKSNRLAQELESKGMIIRQGSSTANNASYIYIGSTVQLVEGEVKLVKMNMSRVSTVFYFEGFMNMEKYDATLTDDWGRVYSLNRSYYEGLDLSDPSIEVRMWFDPIPSDVGSFTLAIKDLETQISTRTKFTIAQDMSYGHVKYSKEVIAIDCDSDSAKVELSSAVFSNTGSQISYALKWMNDDERVVLGRPGDEEYFTLSENRRLVSRDTHTPEQYVFDDDNVILGRVDFVPVRSLNSVVHVNFDNMYKKLAVNKEVSLSDIYYTKHSPQIVLDVGPYKLVIERGGIHVNQYVLVLHALDERLEKVSELSSRVSAFLDVSMVARKADGTTLTLEPSRIHNSEGGTDIVFDGSIEPDFLRGIPIEQISFVIDNVYFQLPPVVVEINLEAQQQRLPINIDNALQALKLAFNRRLGYKSGTVVLNELSRFSEGLLHNSELMREYEPTGLTESASYVVQPSTWYLDGDRLYSVLQETWRGLENGTEKYFHSVHKVVSEYGDRGWIVIEDEIIQ